MAYGLKYISSAYGLSSVEWKIELYEKDYVPAEGSIPIQLTLVRDGIRIGYDREEDRFMPIYSRYAIIDLKVTESFNIDTIQFDDERKFTVKVYKDEEIEFIGWLIPFYASQEFEDTSIATLSIQAKDGINQLSSIDFEDAFPLLVSHRQSFKDLISQCLRNVGYNLDLEIYYNKYDFGMLKTASDCPLSQLFINIKSFKESSKWKDYYEILNTLLSEHDLRLFQANGKWIIMSSIEIVDGAISGRRFNYLGEQQVSNVSISSDAIIGTGGLKIKQNSNIRKGIPIQQFTTNFEFGENRNVVLNGELNDFSDFEPAYWTLSGDWIAGEVTENIGGGISFQDTYATRPSQIDISTPIADASLTSNKYLESDEINIETLYSFNLKAEIFCVADIDAVRVRIEFYNTGQASKYVTTDGKLTLVPSSIYLYNTSEDSFKLLDVSWKNIGNYGLSESFTFMKVRIYEGIRLRIGTPTYTQVKFKNISISALPIDVSDEFLGKKYEIKNNDLLKSKKYDEFTFKYKDHEVLTDPDHIHKLYLSNEIGETNISTGKWKRNSESVEKTLIESRLIDRLSSTSRFGDIFEGSVFGFLNMQLTPYITSESKRFLILYIEYNLSQNTSELLLIELYSSTFTLNTKIFNVFKNDRLVEVSSNTKSTILNLGEDFNTHLTESGGVMYGGLYTDEGIDSFPLDSNNPRVNNKGVLIFGKENAQKIELGNKENQTLVDILGGYLGIANSVFYDNSFTDDNGDIIKKLGLDTYELMIEGDLQTIGKVSVGQDYISLEKKVDEFENVTAHIDAIYSPLFIQSEKTSIIGTLGVSVIEGIGSGGITADGSWNFLQPITIVDGTDPNSAVTRQFLDATIDAFGSGGYKFYETIRAATNSNITLYGLQIIDSYMVEIGDKVLVKNQTDERENYIYIVSETAWLRVTDFLSGNIANAQVSILSGGQNLSSMWICNNIDAPVIGTDNITFRLFYRQFGSVYTAYLTNIVATPQIFQGSHRFDDKIEVPTPLTALEAVNKSYLETTLGSLTTTLTANFWQKISGYGIGTTTNDSISIYTNSVKRAEFSSGGSMTGLKQVFINEGVFTIPFVSAGLGSYYGFGVRDNVHVGALGGTSKTLYSVDLIRADASGYKSGIRFGKYNSGGGLNQFYRGILFDDANVLTVGTYSTTAGSTFVTGSTITIDTDGKFGIGVTPTEKLTLSGNFDLSGRIKVGGNFGEANQVYTSDGSNDVWSLIGVQSIADIADIYLTQAIAAETYLTAATGVVYVTNEGERGIEIYSDFEKTNKEAFIFTNPDTGISAFHAYRLNGSVIEQFGYQMDKEGLPYWLFPDKSRKRILTENDIISGGGGGTTYSLSDPLFFVNNSQINIKAASSTQIGVLSASKFSEFDAKIPDGGTINQYLNFAQAKHLYFGYVSNAVYDARIYHNPASKSLNIQTEDSNVYIGAYGVAKNIEILVNNGYIRLGANKYFIQKGGTLIEIDMSGFAVGKVLKATSSTKAEWVTP